MIKIKYQIFTGLFFVIACVGCNHSLGSESVSLRQAQLDRNTKPNREEPKQLEDIFVNGDRLAYNGYEVLKLKKKVKYEYPDEKGENKSSPIEVSYAVVKKDDRVLAKFEGVYFGLGNSTDFGLFPLVCRDSKQLIVSQTVPRGGRHWIASLDPEFRVLFDSGDYGVGREEFNVIDIDKDGTYEVMLPVTAFYTMQDKMYIAEIPLPEIIFKYDAKAKKYLPANSLFQDYALNGSESEIRNLSGPERGNYLSQRLDIFLRYIYAEKESDAWAFFDREYRLPDKDEMKARIQTILNGEGVYKYIHRKRAI